MGRAPIKHAARWVLLLGGIALAALLLWKTGWSAIESNLASVGWTFAALAVLYLGAEIAFALGWWSVMEPRPPLSALPEILRIYLAGNSVNYLAPGSVAGEPVRAHLLRDRMETSSAIASIPIFKHAHLLSQCVFVAAGVAVALAAFDLDRAVRWGAVASLALLGALLALLTWALRKGSFSILFESLSRFKPLAPRLRPYREGVRAVDDRIRSFYAAHPARFFGAAGWCFLGWCGGLLETYLVLRLLAPSSGWTTAYAVEALAMALNNLFLFVPGRAGTAEGVRAGVFVLLGLPAPTGVAYGLVRRARELLWVLPGLGFLAVRRGERSGRGAIAEGERLAGSGRAK
jgi:glycosyltransferase 2 family protein